MQIFLSSREVDCLYCLDLSSGSQLPCGVGMGYSKGSYPRRISSHGGSMPIAWKKIHLKGDLCYCNSPKLIWPKPERPSLN
jgi:hypothetical protein